MPFPKVKGLSQRVPGEKEAAMKCDRESHQRLNALARLPGNRECADCSARHRGWASLPHGVFLCINCAQIHRRIGRHISQVKSYSSGTYLWYPDEIEAMAVMGNDNANAWYHAKKGAPRKPSQDAPVAVKEFYIRQKYEERKWFAEPKARKVQPAKQQQQQQEKESDVSGSEQPNGKGHGAQLAATKTNCAAVEDTKWRRRARPVVSKARDGTTSLLDVPPPARLHACLLPTTAATSPALTTGLAVGDSFFNAFGV
eukprot:m.11109 g.11109  ORF g.11109 m.11109 type:complete len:256 (+) comp3931_c0_seq2:164-931(+)